MLRVLACILLLIVVSQACAQGVVVPTGGYADKVEVIGDRPVQGDQVWSELYSIPPDDAGRWHMVVFYDSSQASQQLLVDLDSDPDLMKVAAWFNVNKYSIESTSQALRFNQFSVQRDRLPMICCFPPKGSSEYPYCYAYRQTGYTGPARWVAAKVVATVRAFAKMFRPHNNPCPGPYCPTPQPYRPNPAPTPTPYPTPSPTPLPVLPDIVIPDEPPPDVPDAPRPTEGEFPEYAQITVIVDPHGIGEKLKAKALEIVVERVREAYPEIGGAKARVLRLDEPEAKAFPCTPDDTPAVFLTAKGRITGYLNKGTLAVLKDVLQLPDVPVEDARPVVNVAPPVVNVAPPVVQTDPALAAAIQNQAESQGRLHEALAGMKEAGGGKAIAGALTLLGISVPGAALLLGLLIALAVWMYRRRGGHEGFRQRHNARLDWIHDHLPPRLAARTGAIRRKLRQRFHPEELEAMGADQQAEAVAEAIEEVLADDGRQS